MFCPSAILTRSWNSFGRLKPIAGAWEDSGLAEFSGKSKKKMCLNYYIFKNIKHLNEHTGHGGTEH